MNIIEVHQLLKKYDNYTALNNVNFSVRKGSIHGLLGPNGAGKSTLIRILNKILSFDRGKVIVDGKDITAINLKKIGYLPEERGLYKDCTIGYQLLYFARLKGVSKEKADDNINYWLKRLEIENWEKKYPFELSKGMQQKVQFICSVIHNPLILFLDEPFSGLDPLNVQFFKEEIINLSHSGCTIILSTHNMQSVEELCDEISFITKSNIMITKTISSFKKEYNTEFRYEIQFRGNEKEFYSSIDKNFSIEKIEKIEELFVAILKPQPNIVTDQNDLNRLICSVSDKVFIAAFQQKGLSLDQIFIRIVDDKIHS
ncbi:MAG: ATP-binding cassette domain-containing protein [Bacteroidales bacterium]|jgi:ABC-2 type transport system ATP-binding protein|nr:ATP-binding cassette domain-containing protein [Bacteroidales bacterium]